MATKIKSASVKVMLSYDYSHFESAISLENDEGLQGKEIDEARKVCQRLCDKAIGQYKTAKSHAASRSDGVYKMECFEKECKRIKCKDENDCTLREIAMLKQYENEAWQSQFDTDYDYGDDDNYNL